MNKPVPVEKLIALKVYFLGNAILENPHSRLIAHEMVDTAIKNLKGKTDETSMIRSLFYVLLKVSLKKNDSDVIEVRKMAKSLSESTNSLAFKHYIAIEEAAEKKQHEYGIFDSIFRAVSVQEDNLSSKERKFLYKVSLKEMLDKHQIECKF